MYANFWFDYDAKKFISFWNFSSALRTGKEIKKSFFLPILRKNLVSPFLWKNFYAESFPQYMSEFFNTKYYFLYPGFLSFTYSNDEITDKGGGVLETR